MSSNSNGDGDGESVRSVDSDAEEGTMQLNGQTGYPSFIRRESSRNWAETGRTKLQKERQRLNGQITREIEIRAGAERLFRATNNRRHHEQIAAELAAVNANLQILSEEMAELNTSVQVYQTQSGESVPMIPLGLKETVDIDFVEALSESLTRHYHVEVDNATDYQQPIALFMSLRHACRSPVRDDTGIAVLLEYIHTLSLIERRFFTPTTDIRFLWYDSLSGRPCAQKSAAFEKASMLFNVGALQTQIGARQRSLSIRGLSQASVSFEKAAGIFQFISASFNNAPSTDLKPETLRMLTSLMLAQSQECIYELSLMKNTEEHLLHCQEAAQVSKSFEAVHDSISTPPVKRDVPYSWISMILVKLQFYKAKAHFHMGCAIPHNEVSKEDVAKCLDSGKASPKTPNSTDSRRSLARNHVRQATLLFEECIRIHKMCRLLQKVDMLLDVLQQAHDRSLDLYQKLEEEENFAPAVTPPPIIPHSRRIPESIQPDLNQVRVKDPFHSLGPLHFFCAGNEWSTPRHVQLVKGSSSADSSFGFSLRGSAPVSVTEVESGSVAAKAGLLKGDVVVALNGDNTRWEVHEKMVERMRQCGAEMTITVVTPRSPQPTSDAVGRKEASKKLNGHAKKKK